MEYDFLSTSEEEKDDIGETEEGSSFYTNTKKLSERSSDEEEDDVDNSKSTSPSSSSATTVVALNNRVDNDDGRNKIVNEIREEETQGLFRKIDGNFAKKAISFYEDQNRGHYKYLNPFISAPGVQFYIVILNTDIRVANGYMKILTTPHGFFVQIHKSQLVIPYSNLIITRGSPIATTFGWLTFRYHKIEIYYAGSNPIYKKKTGDCTTATTTTTKTSPTALKIVPANPVTTTTGLSKVLLSSTSMATKKTNQLSISMFTTKSANKTIDDSLKTELLPPPPPPEKKSKRILSKVRKRSEFARDYFYIDLKNVEIKQC